MPVIDGAGLVGKVTKVYAGPQRRAADHRSAVLGAGAGAQPGRRRASIVDDVDDVRRHGARAAARSTRRPRPSTTTTTPTVPTTTTTPTGTDRRDAGPTTTSTSSTTTTTIRVPVAARPATSTGQGADRPLLFSFVDDTGAHQREGRRHRARPPAARRAWPRRACRSARSPQSRQRLGSRSPDRRGRAERQPDPAQLRQRGAVRSEPGRDLSRALAAVCPLHAPDPGWPGGPGHPAHGLRRLPPAGRRGAGRAGPGGRRRRRCRPGARCARRLRARA